VDPAVWRRDDMLAALAARDIAAVYRILQRFGVSQQKIANRTGQSQSEVSEILAGRRVISYDVLARIADGLGIRRELVGLIDSTLRPASTSDRAALPASRAGTDRLVPAVREVSVLAWTGLESRALREAMRLSVREFARHLGVSDRVICKWEAVGSKITPRPFSQSLLDTALARSSDAVQARFIALIKNAYEHQAGNDETASQRP
jgi:transcriptional regulator with XRE-family HTH domain